MNSQFLLPLSSYVSHFLANVIFSMCIYVCASFLIHISAHFRWCVLRNKLFFLILRRDLSVIERKCNIHVITLIITLGYICRKATVHLLLLFKLIKIRTCIYIFMFLNVLLRTFIPFSTPKSRTKSVRWNERDRIEVKQRKRENEIVVIFNTNSNPKAQRYNGLTTIHAFARVWIEINCHTCSNVWNSNSSKMLIFKQTNNIIVYILYVFLCILYISPLNIFINWTLVHVLWGHFLSHIHFISSLAGPNNCRLQQNLYLFYLKKNSND